MPASIPATTILPTGEVPTWKSPNELIHERINFDDTIWGFGLAGGAFYKTQLRITYVRDGSRAQKAHIYPGDIVRKINGIDSRELTLEEAHKIILESGVHLQINVTSPEDLEEGYYCYEDPLDIPNEDEEKLKEKKRRVPPRIPKPSGKSSHWDLQWPWKSKRKIIWKESNCYLVPSKYEEKHKDTRKPPPKEDDTIVLDSIHSAKKKTRSDEIESQKKSNNINSSQEGSEDIKYDELVEKCKEDDVIEQHSFEDKNNDDDVKNIDEPENYVAEENESVKEVGKEGSTEQNIPKEKNNDDGIAGEDNPVDTTNEDVQNDDNTEQDSSVDKINEVNTSDQETPVGELVKNVVTEQASSVEEAGKDDMEGNEFVNKNADEQNAINAAEENDINGDQEQNNVTDKEEESIQDKINAEDVAGEGNEKFEK